MALLKLQRIDESLREVNKALQLNKNNFMAYEVRAAIWIVKEEWDKAIADCTKALPQSPNKAFLLQLRAEAFKEKSELDKALKDLDRSLELDNDNPAAYADRATVYMELNQPEKCLHDSSKSIDLGSPDPEVMLMRSEALVELDRPAEALQDLNSLLKFDPENSQYLCARAQVYRLLGNYSKCIQDSSRAIQSNPKNAQAYLERAAANVSTWQYNDTVLSDIKKAMLYGNSDASAYSIRAICYFQQNDFSKAWQDAEKSLSLDRDNWLSWAVEAAVDLKQNNLKQSINKASIAIRLQQNEAWPYQIRGTAYIRSWQIWEGMADLITCMQKLVNGKKDSP